ncbi:MAG: heme NO-binding domain-containing protein, partial [Flavobacteriales bacterium]
MEMVEEQFSPEIADNILDALPEDCSGAYTAVGNYSHEEMIALIVALCEETGLPANDLVQAYGRHLFGEFLKMFPEFFELGNAYLFLESVDA